jgi:hypothetical protein
MENLNREKQSTFRLVRTKLVWPTATASMLFFVFSFLYEVYAIDHTPQHYGAEPHMLLGGLLRIHLLVVFLLGLITFPRWCSFLAILAVLWMLFSAP